VSPRKLSEADKKNIINSYRHSPATTSKLAELYEVSSSTISRFLKNTLSPEEYERLIEQKRALALGKGSEAVGPEVEQLELTEVKSDPAPSVSAKPKPEKAKRRSSATKATSKPAPLEISATATKAISEPAPLEISSIVSPPEIAEVRAEITAEEFAEPEVSPQPEVRVIQEMLGEDSIDIDDEEDDDDDDDEDDDDLEDLEEEDWDEENAYPDFPVSRPRLLAEVGANIEVLPLSESSLPKLCYLVVDKSAELIVKPLKEFSDLGNIPSTEIQQKTLPVFHNHRIALRFSNRSQKVIKVPDGKMLHKTRSYLQAKGITRLLIDGQIYSL
jgi:transposase-like protein